MQNGIIVYLPDDIEGLLMFQVPMLKIINNVCKIIYPNLFYPKSRFYN